MSAIGRWTRRLRSFLNRRAIERELEREMAAHRAMMDDPRRFGSTLRLREESADVWGWTWLERIGQDCRYAARLLRRRPALSATAVLTLMLGTGGTMAMVHLFDALHLRNLPVEEPGELVRLIEQMPGGALRDDFTLITQDMLQRSSRTLFGVLASSSIVGRPDEIEVDGERRAAFVQLVSDNYFDVLGVRAFRGRMFHPPSPGRAGEPIAVISEEYWRRQYGADPSAVGTRFRRARQEFTIAGIALPGFRGTELDVPIDIWVPIDQIVAPDDEDRVRGRWMRIMGRLEPGVTAAQASAEAATIIGRAVAFEAGGNGYSALRGRLHQPLLLVTLVVALVLLIACANLANLMLAATVSRGREIAMRAAIGAPRSRIVRQLVTENLLLAVLGAALGLIVAQWTTGALLAFLPPEQAVALPNLRFEPGMRMFVVAAVLSLGTCLLFGVLPALRAAGTTKALKTGTGVGQRNRSLLGRALLVGQVVMCTTLLIVASVFVRTLENLRSQDAGYREDQLLVADVGFALGYSEERRDQLIEELRARAAALPGVELAAFSHIGQLSGFAMEWRLGFPGRPRSADDDMTVIEQRVSPGFLAAMGTPLTAGRDFTPLDDARAPLVAIINESFVRQFLADQSPLGAWFFLDGGSRAGEPIEIVGVVANAKWVNLRDDAPPMYYRPYRQIGGTPTVRLALRISGEPEQVSRELVRVAASIDPQMTLSNVVPFREIVNRTLVTERLIAQSSTAFGILALVIAAVGLYGVLAYGVARRRREIGVRVAVGARPGTIEAMFLRESLGLVACGVAIGVPVALVVTRLAASLLYGLSPQDPASIGVALAALLTTAGVAAYLPARGAARIDPVHALRED